MKKWKAILMSVLLVGSLGVFTGCGNEDRAADETDRSVRDENDDSTNNAAVNDTKDRKDVGADTTDLPNDGGDVTGEETDDPRSDDGTVTGELGEAVKDVGDGVGDAVQDVGDAVGNAAGNVADGR